MSKAILFGALVLGAGIAGYHVWAQPEVTSTVAQLAPVADATLSAAATLKDQSSQAFDALKATSAGQKITELWSNRTPFFDPMPTPPPKPAP